MSNVINFDFEQQQVDVVEIEGEAWFVAGDVSKILGYAQTNNMNKHIDAEDKMKHVLQNGGNYVNQSLINESGVYSAVFGSKKPEAKRFKKWVTSEVLPRIRKTGGYVQNEENFQSEEELIYHAMQMMERKIREMKPKAEWFDEYVDNNGTLNTTDVAKQLGISAQALNKWMREKGIKFKDKKKDMPRNDYVDWFKMFNFNSHGKVGMQCRITTEGATKIVELYKKSA